MEKRLESLHDIPVALQPALDLFHHLVGYLYGSRLSLPGFSYVSPSITHLQGYTVEEAATMSMEEMMTPASLEAAMRIMAEEDVRDHTGQYDPNRSVTMEVELYRKDGSTVWVENAVTYLWFEHLA